MKDILLMDIAVGVMLVSALGLAFCFWGLYCTQKTGNDRSDLIALAKTHPRMTFQGALEKYDTVSFAQHMWARILLRDWRKLYPKDFISAMKVKP